MGGLSRSVDKRRIGTTGRLVWFQSSPAPSVSHTERTQSNEPSGSKLRISPGQKMACDPTPFWLSLKPSNKKLDPQYIYIFTNTRNILAQRELHP